jgi:hypothetical protein
MATTGRTSAVPWGSTGHRCAHSTASSIVSTSISMKPPSCSRVSANGPPAVGAAPFAAFRSYDGSPRPESTAQCIGATSVGATGAAGGVAGTSSRSRSLVWSCTTCLKT